jgi:hypothetical protein
MTAISNVDAKNDTHKLILLLLHSLVKALLELLLKFDSHPGFVRKIMIEKDCHETGRDENEILCDFSGADNSRCIIGTF